MTVNFRVRVDGILIVATMGLLVYQIMYIQ